MNNKDTGD